MLDIQPNGSQAVRFWQRGGGYDRNIHTAEELWEKITYIHRNPVKRKLVHAPSNGTGPVPPIMQKFVKARCPSITPIYHGRHEPRSGCNKLMPPHKSCFWPRDRGQKHATLRCPHVPLLNTMHPLKQRPLPIRRVRPLPMLRSATTTYHNADSTPPRVTAKLKLQ